MKYRWNILIIFNSVAFFLETVSIKWNEKSDVQSFMQKLTQWKHQ